MTRPEFGSRPIGQKPKPVHEKPQHAFGFADLIVNDDQPFQPKLGIKHHSITGDYDPSKAFQLSQFCMQNPYRVEINSYELLEWQLVKPTELPEVKLLSETPLVIVDSEEKLDAMIAELNESREFAFDVEYYNLHRSFNGITCLVQISTFERDFIVDPFPIWRHMHRLNEPFANPRIRKVVHGCQMDITCIQRDFGIYVVNLLDTKELMEMLAFSRPSCQALVERACGVSISKDCQSSDWRKRPLTQRQIEYARSDSHYLLRSAYWLCQQVKDDFAAMMILADKRARQLCLQSFLQPRFFAGEWRRLSTSKHSLSQEALLEKLWAWKDRVAREEDERPDFILPDCVLRSIVDHVPYDLANLRKCFGQFPISPVTKKRLPEVQKILDDERQLVEAEASSRRSKLVPSVESFVREFMENKRETASASTPPAVQSNDRWCQFRALAPAQPYKPEDDDEKFRWMTAEGITDYQIDRIRAVYGQPPCPPGPPIPNGDVPDGLHLNESKSRNRNKKKLVYYELQ